MQLMPLIGKEKDMPSFIEASKMKKYVILFFSLLVFANEMVMCADKTKKDDKIDGMWVEIEVFSGRANPQFVITDVKIIEEIRQLVRTMQKHPLLTSGSVLRDYLGYRGIMVIDYASADDIRGFGIYHSNVEVRHKIEGGSLPIESVLSNLPPGFIPADKLPPDSIPTNLPPGAIFLGRMPPGFMPPSSPPNIKQDFRQDEGAKLENLLLEYAVSNGIIDSGLANDIRGAK
jgi:hypothetical protein